MSQTDQAKNAIRAAKHRKQWGDHAAWMYCENRGVHPTLYILACQLEDLSKGIKP